MDAWQRRKQRFVEYVAYKSGRLVARVATDEGERPPIGWLKDHFFLGMVEELERQEVSRKVSADMLGVTPRTLQRQVNAARDESSRRDRSMWKQIIDLLENSPMSREGLTGHFRGVPPKVLASLIRDMLDQGWIEENPVGRLVVVERESVTDEQILAYLIAMRAGSRSVEDASAELGVSPERVRALLPQVPEDFRYEADERTRWMAYEVMMRRVFAIMSGALDGRENHKVTMVSVRCDLLPEEALAELRETALATGKALLDLGAKHASPADVWPDDADIWSACLLVLNGVPYHRE